MKFVIDQNGVLKKIKKVKLIDKKIEIPNGVKEIGNSAFFAFKRIEEIIIPDSVEVIGEYAFQDCKSLKKIALPNSIKHIKQAAFYGCKSLKSITIPESVEKIEQECFLECKNLENVEILANIEELKQWTFQKCKNLRIVTLPKSLKKINEFAFTECNTIEKLTMKNKENLKESELWSHFEEARNYYINKETNEILFSKNEIEDCGFEKIEYEEYKKIMNCSKYTAVYAAIVFDIKTIEKHEFLQLVLSRIINYSNNEEELREIEEKIDNYKEFENLVKRLIKKNININKDNGIHLYGLYKLASTLGAFGDDKIQRQRSCEFLFCLLEGELIKFNEIHPSFTSLIGNEYKKEWAQFFMKKNNILELVKLEKMKNGNISRIYNSFDYIKEFGRSNRGDQHYRTVTIAMCNEYFSKISFNGVDQKTEDIAKELSKYTRDQQTFDEAKETREKYLKLKEKGLISEHILKKELKEIKKEIVNDIAFTTKELSDIANKKFTYEFLSKYDPINFVLGKYCSCCAHLEGLGCGVAIASVIHPDCQNLVIRNKNGKIIAKSTLYINREQGYVVFNNIEINSAIIDKNSKKLIYKKYMEAIESFINIYNEENKNNPIKQVNVGMGLNDLERELEKNHKYSKEILRGIDFSYYGGYKGDWQDKQIVLLKEGVRTHGR